MVPGWHTCVHIMLSQGVAFSRLMHEGAWQHVDGTQSASATQTSRLRTSSLAGAPGASAASEPNVEASGAGRVASAVGDAQAASRESAESVARERRREGLMGRTWSRDGVT